MQFAGPEPSGHLCIFWASWRISWGLVDAHSNSQRLQLVADIPNTLSVGRNLVIEVCICQSCPVCFCSCLTAVQKTARLFNAARRDNCIFRQVVGFCIQLKLWHPVAVRTMKEVSKMVASYRCRDSSSDPLMLS